MSLFSFTLVTPKIDAETRDLIQAAKKLGVQLTVRDVLPDEKVEGFDRVVLWRGSSVGKIGKRTAVLQKLYRNHFLINPCLAFYPEATRKSFQQKHFSLTESRLQSIPTYTFSNKEELLKKLEAKQLSFPLIEKPDIGNRGRGVRIILSPDELRNEAQAYQKYIYQKFIRNNGDFRVLIVGGKALGAMKRTAPENSLINNISLGGSAEAVEDPELKNFLCSQAELIANHFSLFLCGVDIIQDQETGGFYFLEVNTLPEWQGFQKATGIDVPLQILRFCQQLAARDQILPSELVLENYWENQRFLRKRRFHFLSRMYLWTREKRYQEALESLRDTYLKGGKESSRELLASYLASPRSLPQKNPTQVKRAPYLKKYPLLLPYNDLLFKRLFAETIYGENLSHTVNETVAPEQLLSLWEALSQDKEAVRTLSTHAINFFFLSAWHLEQPRLVTEAMLDTLIPENLSGFTPEELRLALYLFTHCIIGHSLFYSRPLTEEWKAYYREKMGLYDQMLQQNFPSLSLDGKLEFLVCARILGYTPNAKEDILQEANSSLAPYENHLTDQQNIWSESLSSPSFVASEHRNVLFIMATVDSPLYPYLS